MNTSDDVTQIVQLLNQYCHVVDRGSAEEVAALFHPEAVLKPVYEGTAEHRGRAAILAWYSRYGAAAKGAVDHLRHRISCPWVQVDGDTASAVCYLDADSVSRTSGATTLSQGRYEDRLVRHDGRWLFMERAILVHNSVTLGG